MIEYVIAGAIGGAVVLFMLKDMVEKKIEEMVGEILNTKKGSGENPIALPVRQFPDEKEVDINELGKSTTSIDYSQLEPNKLPEKKQDR